MKKKILLFAIVLLVSAAVVYGESGTIIFSSGKADHRDRAGNLNPAVIGNTVVTGESIITGGDGFVEIQLENNSVISINEDTVFNLSEREDQDQPGRKRGVFQTILGAVGFKFQQFSGNEPYIETSSTVCGVRGTDFTVFAGADGSAVYAVASGEVAVNSGGREVALLPDQGVEVAMGRAPGNVFRAEGGIIDFSQYQEEAKAAVKKDPLGTYSQFENRLNELIEETRNWNESAYDTADMLKELEATAQQIREEDGEDAFMEYMADTVDPLKVQTQTMILNRRFTAYSALLLRQHLICNVYLEMRTKYILDPENPEYLAFLRDYNAMLDIFYTELIETKYLYEGDY